MKKAFNYSQATKRGDELTPAEQRHVLASFVHRFTGEHRPQWANAPRPDGSAYPLQFTNDAEWLRNTEFNVTPAGALDTRVNSCLSHPTWPNNPELRKTITETGDTSAMSDNEKGYLVYCWEQKGYNFIPLKYDENRDYTHYLKYYTDPEQNEKLIAHVLSQKEK